MTTWQFVTGIVFLLLVGAVHGLFVVLWIRWVLKKI